MSIFMRLRENSRELGCLWMALGGKQAALPWAAQAPNSSRCFMPWQPRMEGGLSILGLDVSWDCEAAKWEEGCPQHRVLGGDIMEGGVFPYKLGPGCKKGLGT